MVHLLVKRSEPEHIKTTFLTFTLWLYEIAFEIRIILIYLSINQFKYFVSKAQQRVDQCDKCPLELFN